VCWCTAPARFRAPAPFVDRLNRRGKPYYVLTNDASKLAATAAARYRGYGLPLEADRIITSGALLAPYFAAHGLVGRRCAVLGAADSIAYVELAGEQVVPAPDLIYPSPTGVGVASGSVAWLAAAASANPSSSMVAGARNKRNRLGSASEVDIVHTRPQLP